MGSPYPARIELFTPGSLLVSRVQLLQGGVSECRNKSVQLMFQRMGGGDRAGSGMDKIRAGWRAQHWRSPRLEESLQPDRVKLVLPLVSLIPDEVDQALRGRFCSRSGALSKPGNALWKACMSRQRCQQAFAHQVLQHAGNVYGMFAGDFLHTTVGHTAFHLRRHHRLHRRPVQCGKPLANRQARLT